ncbi:MAG: NrfJ-related protein [Sulfuricella sp.]
MKSILALLALAAFSSVAVAAPTGHPAAGNGMMMPKGATNAPLPQKGKVLSTIEASPYTYIEVSQGKKTVWLAASSVALKKGNVIRFDDGMVMSNFHSKTLNRTFPTILFVNRVAVTNEKE